MVPQTGVVVVGGGDRVGDGIECKILGLRPHDMI